MPAAPDHEPDIRFRFGHDLRAAADARKKLAELLRDPDDPIADDVRLATSELVANVVRHTADGGEVRAWDPRPDAPLRVEVEDPGSALPKIPTHMPAVGGRGLAIVDAVADAWGVEVRTASKVVWAEFDRMRRRRGATA